MEDDLTVVQKYIDFLLEHEIISFVSNLQNGTVFYRVDTLGNDLAKILITLEDADGVWAYTELNFEKKGYKMSKIIKLFE